MSKNWSWVFHAVHSTYSSNTNSNQMDIMVHTSQTYVSWEHQCMDITATMNCSDIYYELQSKSWCMAHMKSKFTLLKKFTWTDECVDCKLKKTQNCGSCDKVEQVGMAASQVIQCRRPHTLSGICVQCINASCNLFRSVNSHITSNIQYKQVRCLTIMPYNILNRVRALANR